MTTRKRTTRKRTSKKLEKIFKPVWCEYHKDDLVPPIIVNRFDDRVGNRFYYFVANDEVKVAVGVTSAFGIVSTERESINKWKEDHDNWRQLLNDSADYGTALHLLYENLLLGKGVSKVHLDTMRSLAVKNGQSADMPEKDLLSFLKFMEDYKPEPLLIEAQLVLRQGDDYLAMTIDLLAKITFTDTVKETIQDGFYLRGEKKGEPKMIDVKKEVVRESLVLIDFKSNFFEKERKSFYETHMLQLIAGAKAVEQNFGFKVDAVYNYSGNAWRTNPGYTLYEHKVSDDDLNTFYAYWNLITAKKINVPKGNILVCNNPKTSEDFKWVSYLEYAQERLLPQPIEA